jgi:hypothetical protein
MLHIQPWLALYAIAGCDTALLKTSRMRMPHRFRGAAVNWTLLNGTLSSLGLRRFSTDTVTVFD